MKKFYFLSLLFSGFVMASEINARVSQGDLAALDSAFKKLAKSDGHVAEELDTAIGKSITRNPENFLRAYNKHKASVRRLDAVVGNLGPDFVDDFPRQAAEIRKRIRALQDVKSKTLRPLAAKCTLTCAIALLLVRIAHKRARQAGFSQGAERMLELLSGVKSALVFYPQSNKPQRMICSISDEQRDLLTKLGHKIKDSM